MKLEEKEHPVRQQHCDDGRVQDLRDGAAGGGGGHGHVQDGVRDQVLDDEPVRQPLLTISTKVKPKNWKLVKKRGIVPDGLVQAKLKCLY